MPDHEDQGKAPEHVLLEALNKARDVIYHHPEVLAEPGVRTNAGRFVKALATHIANAGGDPTTATVVDTLQRQVEILVQAIVHTVEYLGNDVLPVQEGWSWYDALKQVRPEVAKRFEDNPSHFPSHPFEEPLRRLIPSLIEAMEQAGIYPIGDWGLRVEADSRGLPSIIFAVRDRGVMDEPITLTITKVPDTHDEVPDTHDEVPEPEEKPRHPHWSVTIDFLPGAPTTLRAYREGQIVFDGIDRLGAKQEGLA